MTYKVYSSRSLSTNFLCLNLTIFIQADLLPFPLSPVYWALLTLIVLYSALRAQRTAAFLAGSLVLQDYML